MGEDKKINELLDNVIEKDIERKKRRGEYQILITLKDYLKMVYEDKRICNNAASRLLDIILSYGEEEIPKHEQWMGVTKRYSLYTNDLYGMDFVISRVVEHLINGSVGASSGKYLLVLVGPTSSGKSTLLDLTKNALEQTKLYPVFAIKGCPIREDPLHAIPRHLTYRAWNPREHNVGDRPIEDSLGIPPIEGDLCPVCRHMLDTQYTDEIIDEVTGKKTRIVRWWDIPVESFTYSVQGVRGISTFVPGDDLTQSMSDLIGRENIGVTQNPARGYNDPFAFELNGEVENANRGLLEGEELLKAKSEILRVFISLAEEKRIKVQGSKFPPLYIDEVVIGHCNLNEYKKFSADKGNAALHDRMIFVPCPYTARVRDEVKVYKKLIERESEYKALKNVHIPEATYLLAATFAGLTRIYDSKNATVNKLMKLKLYNGEQILIDIKDKDKMPIDTRQLFEEYNNPNVDIEKREGMFGVSYRDVLAALNMALAHLERGSCLTPLTAIQALRNIWTYRTGYSPEEIKSFYDLLSEKDGPVMNEYRNFVIKTVDRAYIRGYRDLIDDMYQKFLREARLFRAQTRKFVRMHITEVERDPRTGKPLEADVKYLKSICRHMGISDSQMPDAIGEILEYLEYSSSPVYEPLRKACEAKIIEDNSQNIILLFEHDAPKTSEQRQRVQDVFEALEEMGFCKICTTELCKSYYEYRKT